MNDTIRPLSPREAEIAKALGEGLSYGATARQLGVTRITVRKTAKNICAKLPTGCQSKDGPIATIKKWILCRCDSISDNCASVR